MLLFDKAQARIFYEWQVVKNLGDIKFHRLVFSPQYHNRSMKGDDGTAVDPLGYNHREVG
jgi:hypothetical protein